MTLNEYQAQARAYATGGGLRPDYAVMGLAEEAGEAVGKVAKFVRATGRDANDIALDGAWRGKLVLELGDALWMVSNAAAALNVELDDLALQNLVKLSGRKRRGTICGEGDGR